jgi:hypothetical protein
VFDWLFEGRLIVYVALVLAGLAFLMLWWSTRKRGLLVAAGVMAVLIGVYFLLDRAVETDREQIHRKVEEMAAAITDNDLDRAFEVLSDQFHTPRGTDKDGLRRVAQTYRASGQVNRVKVWDIRIGSLSREQGQAKVGFNVKVEPAMNIHLWCDTVFDHDDTHGWRLRTFRLYDPSKNNEEFAVPF